MKILSSFTLLFIFLFAALTTLSAITINALTDAQQKNLTKNLEFFEAYLNNSIIDARTQLATTGTTCSIDNYACDPEKNVPKMNFSELIPAEYGHVQPKEWTGQDRNTQTDIQRKVCQLSRMGPKWLQNYNDSSKKVLYQYFTFSEPTVNLFGVYPQSPFNCSAVPIYTPTTRPFYTSSAVGQKDVVILLDASTKTANAGFRLDMAKKIATRIVESMSFKDYVAVIPFGDAPDEQTSILTQATETNIGILKTGINEITARTNNGTNIGEAIDRAFSVMATSKTVSLSSDCTRMIVLLTGGDNTFVVPQAGSALSRNRDAILFPVLINQNPNSTQVNLVNQLACATATIVTNVTDNNNFNISAPLENINKYFTSIQATTVFRWSAVYEDAFGQGSISSLSAPVFTKDSENNEVFSGVTTLDASLSDIIGDMTSITAQEVTDFLQGNSVCTPLNQRGSRQAAVIAGLQGGKCKNVNIDAIGYKTTAKGEELAITKAMPGIIVGSVFLILILFGVGCYFNNLNGKDNYSYKTTPVYIALGIFLVCWIISIPIMFTLVAPDLVEVNNFVETRAILVSTTATPYRCCELTSCSYCSYTSSPSCASEIAAKTRDVNAGNGPFECNNNYKCCSYRTYECNCGRTCSGSGSSRSCSETCSTCRECIRSVSRHQCSLSCGTCYAMKTLFRYNYKNDLYQSQWTRSCTLGVAQSCKRAWESNYVVPGSRQAWVNPEDPLEVKEVVEIRSGPFAAFMVFACLSIPCFLYAYFIVFRECAKTTCEDDSSSSSDKGGFSWSQDDDKKPDPVPVDTSNGYDNNNNSGYNNNQPGYGNNDNSSGYGNQSLPPVAPPPSGFNANNTGDNVPPPAGGYNFQPMGGNNAMYPGTSIPANNAGGGGGGYPGYVSTNNNVPPPGGAGGVSGF